MSEPTEEEVMEIAGRLTKAQDAHERWNANHYPGTRQLCCVCDEPTGRCEEDAHYVEDDGPFCDEHYEAAKELKGDANGE